MKKSLFCTFIFACIPGAGQMYLEYMKRGLSLMVLFFGIIGFSTLTHMRVLIFALPIILCYSFFDTFHIRNASAEELIETKDSFILNLDNSEYVKKFWATRHKNIGIVLVISGVYVMIINMDILPEQIMEYIQRYFPTLVTTIILIAVGIKFMAGGRNEE